MEQETRFQEEQGSLSEARAFTQETGASPFHAFPELIFPNSNRFVSFTSVSSLTRFQKLSQSYPQYPHLTKRKELQI